MATAAPAPTLIQSLQRGLMVVEAITQHGPLKARAISDLTGIVLPTTYHLLRTLIHEDYLCRLPDGRYGLGRQLISVSRLEARARTHRLLREVMAELSATTRAHIVVGVLDEPDIVTYSAVEHPGMPRVDYCAPGVPVPGHATSVGKCILAQLTSGDREQYLQRHPLTAFTSQTMVGKPRLLAALSENPPVVSEQEYRYGMSCAAHPLRSIDEVAAIGAVYPSDRGPRARLALQELLARAADTITEALPVLRISARPVVA